MIYIVIGNIVIWLFSLMDSSGMLINYLSFSPYKILHGQVWRLLTFALIPNETGFFALIYFYFYYFIGKTLENEWGAGRFTIYVFSGILLTVIYGFVLYFASNVSYGVTAEFIYLSMIFAFATLYADTKVLLFGLIPIKMKWIGIVDAVFFAIEIIILPFPVNLLPVVAVLNYFIFCGSWIFDFFRPGRIKQRRNVISFKNEVNRIQREQTSRPYSRKCEVCGKTDTDNPGLEFRYCSRCEGFHCYCMDHINSHTHITK